MQVPVRACRMEENVVDEQSWGQVVDVLADRQQRCHYGVAGLHHGIGNEYPQQCLPQGRPGFADIEQIA